MKMNSKYYRAKNRARERAIEWQQSFCDQSYSWEEIAKQVENLRKLAVRYGLLTEFRENGVI